MDVVHPRCAGLDIHKKTIVACRLLTDSSGHVERTKRTFETFTDAIEALGDWLIESGVTHVAMESTGVYWQPIWNLLEDRLTLVLANAQHVKAVPGRKTDVKDAEWLAELLRHGLIQGSVVPDRDQREERELLRYRARVVRERTGVINRLHKTLEAANTKLGTVASNIVGVSARAMLDQLVAGATDRAALAALARGRLRDKQAELERALDGRLRHHQRFLIAEMLGHLDELDERIARLDAEVVERQRPFDDAVEQLDAIPGIGPGTARVLVAELGPLVNRFPTAHHCAAWAGVCPGADESAGKRRSGRTRKGNRNLRAALVEAAQAAGRTQTYPGAQYRRLKHRLGASRAAVAVAHTLLIIAYHLLRDGGAYTELGADYFVNLESDQRLRRLKREAARLGYNLQPLEATA